jgi:hypothetical protein
MKRARDNLICGVVVEREYEISVLVVDTKLRMVAKSLARPTRQFEFDARYTDSRSAPLCRCRDIEQVTQGGLPVPRSVAMSHTFRA